MTRAIHEAHSRGAIIFSPACGERRVDPRLGFCRLCYHEMRVHGDVAALAADGDPEGIAVYQHLRTAKHPEPERDKRARRLANK